MSTPQNDRFIKYTSAGGETVFDYDFQVDFNNDIAVDRLRAGTVTTLTPGADYTVTGLSQPAGGTIVLTSPSQAGDIYALYGINELNSANFNNTGPFTPAALNAQLDQNTRIGQQLRRDLDRTFYLPLTETEIDLTLPRAALRANGVMGFNNAGAFTVIPTDSLGGGGGGGGVPLATYITQTPSINLPNAQSLDNLTAGILKNSGGTGVLSIAQPGIDYSNPAALFNVRDYGAIGDSVQDDTNAFQDAIDAAEAFGFDTARGTVVVPPGIYIVDEMIISKPIAMIGYGRWNTHIRKKDGNNKSLITVNAIDLVGTSIDDTARTLIKDMRLVGNRTDQVTTDTSHGIYCPEPAWDISVQYSASVDVDAVEIQGFTGNGIFLDTNRNWAFITNTIVRYCNDNGYLIKSYDCRFIACDAGVCKNNSIYHSGGGATLFNGVNVYSSEIGLKIDEFTNSPVWATNCSFDLNRKNGVIIVSTGIEVNHSITACRFEGNASDADNTFSDIKITDSAGLTVSGCQFLYGGGFKPAHLVEKVNAKVYFIGNNYLSSGNTPYATAVTNDFEDFFTAGNLYITDNSIKAANNAGNIELEPTTGAEVAVIDCPIKFDGIVAPGTPPAGEIYLYAKADKKLYIKNDSGLETDLTATGGGGVGVPGGSSGEMQYNNAGAFGGDTGFTTNGAGTISITGLLNVDNIRIDGNTILSTNANGDIEIDPNGTGVFNIVDTHFLVSEIAAPGTPSAGKVAIYAKNDGKLYIKDDGGTETDLTALTAAGGSPTYVQYNNAGGFAGDANFTTNGAGTVAINGVLSVDNVRLDGNSISSVNTNGNIDLDPNGTGQVRVIGTPLIVDEVAAPSTPSSGKVAIYAKTDGQLYIKDDAGTETNLATTTPGGSTTQIQYNNAGALAGDSGFTTNGSGTVTIGTQLSVANLRLDGNSIRSINTDGDINIDPFGAGTGKVRIVGTPLMLDEIAAPATPDAGRLYIYAKTDNELYSKNDAGVEKKLSGPGGSTTQIQYNNAGLLAGDTGFVTNGAGTITVTGQFNADNLRLDGNILSSTNTNGNVDIDPSGLGQFRILNSPIIVDEVAAPATPSAGKVAVYAKTDGLLYSKDDAGTETALGVASAGGLDAWVNFNGTGVLAINSSFNVTSVTDNGTGDYTVNFTSALSNANYAVTFGLNGQSPHAVTIESGGAIGGAITTKTTTALRIGSYSTGSTRGDFTNISVMIAAS